MNKIKIEVTNKEVINKIVPNKTNIIYTIPF